MPLSTFLMPNSPSSKLSSLFFNVESSGQSLKQCVKLAYAMMPFKHDNAILVHNQNDATDLKIIVAKAN